MTTEDACLLLEMFIHFASVYRQLPLEASLHSRNKRERESEQQFDDNDEWRIGSINSEDHSLCTIITDKKHEIE